MIDFSTLQGLTILEGVVKKITDAHGNVLWNGPSLASVLVDFEYVDNGDGTVTIISWKGTLNGVASTEIVIPDDSRIIL